MSAVLNDLKRWNESRNQTYIMKKIIVFLSAFIILSQSYAVDLFEPLAKKDLLLQAMKYQRKPIVQNGKEVIDEKTGQVKTQSRVLRGEMRQNCKEMTDSQIESFGAVDWKGYPLEYCQYRVIDTAGKKLVKEASVILVKLTDDLLAQWMTHTCTEINQPNMNCIQVLTKRIIMQSNGQFAVRGIVYEDQYLYDKDPKKKIVGQDGYNEPYCFRDGVTVYINDFGRETIGLLSEEQKKGCFFHPLTNEEEKVGRMARIQGTTADSYLKLSSSPLQVMSMTTSGAKIANENWLTASRLEMQKALRTGINNMLTIWARSNPSQFVKK